MSGSLLLDDNWVLQPLLEGGGLQSAAEVRQFIFANDAGPSGRPVAMLSLWLNAGQPLDVASLKLGNLLLHLLTGLALFWFASLLAQALGAVEKQRPMAGPGNHCPVVAASDECQHHALHCSTYDPAHGPVCPVIPGLLSQCSSGAGAGAAAPGPAAPVALPVSFCVVVGSQQGKRRLCCYC